MQILRPENILSFPEPRDLTPEQLKQANALARAAFTAEDLQRYAELDEGVAADEVLREMEELEKQLDEQQS
jgi:hypothetical protein